MKLYRLIVIIIAAAAIILFAAMRINKSQRSLIIEGQIIGNGIEKIYLEQSINGVRQAIDSAKLSDIGEFKLVVKAASEEPALYELRYNWERAPILGKRGERISINSIGRFSLNYTVEGSPESELLHSFYQPYLRESEHLNRVAQHYAKQNEDGEDSNATAAEYVSIYNNIKREQLKFIVTNKGNMAALYALFQRLPGDDDLINETSDLIYMRTVADSVSHNYPNSAYLKILEREIELREARETLFNSMTYSNYPDLNLDDMYGNKVKLSSLDGSVILLDFWSAALGTSNPNNASLKELYKEYHDAGFEIYQVGIDTSKSVWVNAIQQQRLPWISVSDLQGGNSTTLRLYNVQSIPSNILISKSGDIVGRNLYGEQLEAAIKAQCAVR